MSDLSHPAAVKVRLEGIEDDLAVRQNRLETAALDWFRAKRDREKERATQFLAAQKAVVRVLDTRAAIGMSILRSQERAS